MEKNQENYYSARTTILGNIVTAEQNAISNAESNAKNYATTKINGLVIPDEDTITTITNNAITTAQLSANQIVSGTIDAARINVDDLLVSKLKTDYDTDGSYITVDSEGIVLYGTGASEVLRIKNTTVSKPYYTGSETSAPSVCEDKELTFSGGGSQTQYVCWKHSSSYLGSITKSVTKDTKVTINSLYVTFDSISLSQTGKTISNATINFYPQILIKATLNGKSKGSTRCNIKSPSLNTGFTGTYDTFTSSGGTHSSDASNNFNIDEDGTLQLDFSIPVSDSVSAGTSSNGAWWITRSDSSLSGTGKIDVYCDYKIEPNPHRFTIGSNGFLKSNTNGYLYSDSGEFTVVCGNYGFRVHIGDGIKKTTDKGVNWVSF